MKKVLYVVLSMLVFGLLAVPAMALDAQPTEGGDTVCLNVTIEPIGEFTIENHFNDIVIADCDDFTDTFDLGYIQTTVCTNQPWQLWGHWENVCDEGQGMAFPADWMIWWSTGGGAYAPLTQDENGQVMDSGDCDDVIYTYEFELTGPDICDLPGLYNGEVEFWLGPA